MRRLLLLAAAVPAAAQADPLQQRLLADARATDAQAFAFTETTRVERTGAAAKEIVRRYDPAAAAATRWTLLRVDNRAPTAKEIAEARKAARGPVPSYGRIAEWIGAPATRIATGAGSVTYRFARLPKGVVKFGSHDASGDTMAEAVVNTAGKAPFVERVRFTSTASFRVALVAKVERYVVSASYRVLPDGRPVPLATSADMAGSLVGKSGTLTTRTGYSDVRAVR